MYTQQGWEYPRNKQQGAEMRKKQCRKWSYNSDFTRLAEAEQGRNWRISVKAGEPHIRFPSFHTVSVWKCRRDVEVTSEISAHHEIVYFFFIYFFISKLLSFFFPQLQVICFKLRSSSVELNLQKNSCLLNCPVSLIALVFPKQWFWTFGFFTETSFRQLCVVS